MKVTQRLKAFDAHAETQAPHSMQASGRATDITLAPDGKSNTSAGHTSQHSIVAQHLLASSLIGIFKVKPWHTTNQMRF